VFSSIVLARMYNTPKGNELGDCPCHEIDEDLIFLSLHLGAKKRADSSRGGRAGWDAVLPEALY